MADEEAEAEVEAEVEAEAEADVELEVKDEEDGSVVKVDILKCEKLEFSFC